MCRVFEGIRQGRRLFRKTEKYKVGIKEGLLNK